jgi:predicted site-specific integrase-resolvase
MTLRTLPEVARDLGLSYQTIFRYVKKGVLRTQKVGITHAVTADEFEHFKRWYATYGGRWK